MKNIIRSIYRRIKLFYQRFSRPSNIKLYHKAVSLGLFNKKYYEEKYGRFISSEAAFYDYLQKASFANVNPSENFDTEYYLRTNLDVYHSGVGALQHYLNKGKKEGRSIHKEINRWIPKSNLHPSTNVSDWQNQKIAVCLHIYYNDFIDKFSDSLYDFPAMADLYIAVKNKSMATRARKVFAKLSNVNKVKVIVAPNRGRNFGALLVEFSDDLVNYDLMCHAHSKKSLYSGREQVQWSNYLNQYLLKDRHVVITLLKLFKENQELGVYYPTSFWMMPSWVNHWTCNKPFVNKHFSGWGINVAKDFLAYPVGGMFWARPKVVFQWLEKKYVYEDFPTEPLPADGSYLHAMERAIGLLAERNGYKQFFYHPQSGSFTEDQSYININYERTSFNLGSTLSTFDIILFDVFDTLLRREYFVPDYAKLKLGKILVEEGFFKTPQEFVKTRNNAEFQVRKRKKFQQDVIIDEVYQELGNKFEWTKEEQEKYLDLEFQYDLDMVLAKDEMLNIANDLSFLGKEIWLVTDTYYRQEHIEQMMKKIGLVASYKLFVSSEMGKRKDNGSMWRYIKGLPELKNKRYIHVGDNVRSDAQICGDHGLANIHVLNPYDKWLAAGFDDILSAELDEENIIKYGKLISNFGRYPFFGE